MATLLTFDELWAKINSAHKAGNSFYYHPCCDVWTTRASKAKRASHTSHLQWKQISATLDKSVEDKKQALQAKMIEECWRLPSVVNGPCSRQPNQSSGHQLPFNLYNQDQPQQCVQAGLAEQDFIYPSQTAAEMTTISGACCLT